MQGATPATVDFEGIQKQTILFEDDTFKLDHNIKVTETFLNSLDRPIVHGSRLVWNNVNYNAIKNGFFSKYIPSDKEVFFSNLEAFIKWCDAIDEDNLLDNWSVILSSKGEILENSDHTNMWEIQGYNVSKVSRTVLGNRQNDGKTISIGALRAPKDLLSDILDLSDDELNSPILMENVRLIREEHGVANVPQLVIYCIDKDSKPATSNKNNRRSQLDFSQDIIGISLMIPGMRKSKNIATSLTVRLQPKESDIDLEE